MASTSQQGPPHHLPSNLASLQSARHDSPLPPPSSSLPPPSFGPSASPSSPPPSMQPPTAAWEAPLVRLNLSKLPAFLPIKDASLAELALTHRSFFGDDPSRFPDPVENEASCNKRLELRGDSVLQCIVTEMLLDQYEKLGVAAASTIRGALLANNIQAYFARTYGLQERIKMSRDAFASGVHRSPKVLADAFEAHVGGLWEEARRLGTLDALDVVKDWVRAIYSDNVFPSLDAFARKKTEELRSVGAAAPKGKRVDVTAERKRKRKWLEGERETQGLFDEEE